MGGDATAKTMDKGANSANSAIRNTDGKIGGLMQDTLGTQ